MAPNPVKVGCQGRFLIFGFGYQTRCERLGPGIDTHTGSPVDLAQSSKPRLCHSTCPDWDEMLHSAMLSAHMNFRGHIVRELIYTQGPSSDDAVPGHLESTAARGQGHSGSIVHPPSSLEHNRHMDEGGECD
jgi:hypothetical protein